VRNTVFAKTKWHLALVPAAPRRRYEFILGWFLCVITRGYKLRFDLRVAIRRLSRCLRVFTPFFPGDSWKKIRRQLAGLMEATGRVRDRDIALQLLAEAGIPPRAAIATRLATERRKASRELLLEIRRWKGRSFSRKWRSRLELSA
jgi:CHAD domain-containing protein